MTYPKNNSSYGKVSEQAPNPYARAVAAWDERIGSARVQALNWRYIAFASMGLAILSTAGAVTLAIKKQVAAYVIEVDKVGMPGRITLMSDAYKPEPSQIGYFVGEVVRLVRERPLDPVVMRQQWMKAYQFLAGHAVNSMNDYAATDSGLRSVPGNGALARTVEIGSVLQKSDGSYQVRWVETTYSSGARKSQEEYTGLFQVKLIRPRDESDTFKNPLGVYITSFTWGREFSGPIERETRSKSNPTTQPQLGVKP